MNKRPSALDYKKYGAQLDKNLVDAAFKTPGDYKPAEGLIDDISQINKKPLSTGEAIFEGGLAGLKAGMKKADQDKTTRVLEWFQQNAMAAKQQNDWHMQREQERETIAPWAAGAISDAFSGRPYDETDSNLRNMWNTAKKNYPELFKGEYISHTPNSALITVDMGNGPETRNMAEFAPEALKDNQQLYIQRQALGVNQQRADDYGRGVDSNVALHNAQIDKIKNAPPKLSPEQQAFNTEQHKILGKKAGEDLSNLEVDEEKAHGLLDSLKNMKLALTGGAITNENALSAGKLWWGEKFGTKAFYETKNFNVAAKNFLPRIKELFGGRITNADLKLSLEYLVANNDWNKTTIDKFIRTAEAEVEQKLKRLGKIRKLAKENGGTLPLDYQYRIYGDDNLDTAKSSPTPQQPQGNGGMVLMVDPNTGLQEPIPSNQVERAEQLGLKRVR